MRILVTGAAGFIGYHLSSSLLAQGHSVHGYDAMTPYYDPALKEARLARLEKQPGFTFTRGMLEDADLLNRSADEFAPEVIVHLAAQAGVRYSIESPETYVDSNILGTFNVIELCRRIKPRHLLFASTSSVYGGNTKLPFSELDRADHPVSLYAATKKAGEALTHSYSHLFAVPTTCFRFFTVYGPWGRPDMALFKFVDRIAKDEEIDVYGEGKMARDFTYIDDLVSGIEGLIPHPPSLQPLAVSDGDSRSPVAPWRVVNIAGGVSVSLLDFVRAIENSMGRTARINLLPMQAGDVRETLADASLLLSLTGARPTTPVSRGVEEFVNWYREYYG